MRTNAWVLGVALLLASCRPGVISRVDDEPVDLTPDAAAAPPDTAAPPSPAPDADFRVNWADAGTPLDAMDPEAGQPHCGIETFTLKPRPAELMLILDRSGTMAAPAAPGSTTTKWQDVTAALDEAMTKTDQVIQWGMKAFPTNDLQCHVADGVEVPPAPMNHATVRAQIMASTPDGDGTPTTLALQKALAYLAARPAATPRYLVLATDGEPNCQAGAGRSGARDDAGAVMAVTAALQAGIKTFVIGVATGPAAETVLSDMAQAGGVPRPGTSPYYPATNRAELISALGEITAIVTDCVFTLAKAPPSPDNVQVSAAGAPVMRDPAHTNGWDYGSASSTSSITFYGPACEQVKKGASQDIRIVFGCPAIN